MATFEDVFMPRKRIATYGKAVSRRIPDYNYGSQPNPVEREQSESLSSRSSSVALAEPKNINDISRTLSYKSPPSTIPAKSNVFDVPSSDDDAPPRTPKPVTKTAPKLTKVASQKVATGNDSSMSRAVDSEKRKRVKISPVRPLSQKSGPKKILATDSTLGSAGHTSKLLQKTLGMGNTSTIATRPKLATAAHRKADSLRLLRKPSSSPTVVHTPSTPSPERNTDGTDVMDVDVPTNYISPRGLQMWRDLLDPLGSNEPSVALETFGEKDPGVRKSTAQLFNKTLYKPAGVTKHPHRNLKAVPRKRLIDSLVEQLTNDDGDEPDDEEEDATLKPDSMLGISNDDDRSRSQSVAPEFAPPPAPLTSQVSQITGPKFTYTRQRSMLAEEDLMQQLALDMPAQPSQPPNGRRPRRGSIPVLKPLQSFHEEAEEEDGTATTIRSVHELRQAGANNRFLDEIEDLLDRIGKPSPAPSSMRRSGLLDLASKIRDKNFVRQFRANGVEQRLFVHLGQETDVVAGFLMVSILMAVLFDASMPHIVGLLRRQGITRLLIRLLDSQTNIVSLSKDRKSNMSKVAQSLVSEHQDFILKIPLWEDLLPQIISSRTVALKCLELMVRQTREAGNSGDIFSKELTTMLFSILNSAPDASSWDLPQGKQAIDFYLALSALESHSIMARTLHDETIWISDYLPIVADSLETAMRQPSDSFGPLQGLILRLTLNVTNNNPQASNVFARGSLMAIMGQVVVTKFKMILRFLTEEDFSVAVDHLILVLGVMINFAEWSAPARESLQSLQGKDIDPLQNMVQLFVDNKMRTSEAESVEESQKNVAFGYLSVLLGYLSLLPQISTRIATQQPRKTLRPLIESIEEFIGHHKAADILIEEAEDGHDAQTGLTERLERLVAKLG